MRLLPRRLSIFIFFLSSFLAFVGGHIVNYSAIIYAQDMFGSDLYAGIGFGLCFGPPLILGWVAGVYCDRYPPIRLVFYAQALFALVGVLLYGMTKLPSDGLIQVYTFMIICFLVGVAWSFLSPARLAALAQIVPRATQHRATIIFNLLIMIGFGVAPLLIDAMRRLGKWEAVFILIFALFVIANALLLSVKHEGGVPSPQHSNISVLRQVRDGINAVSSTPLLWQLLVCVGLIYGMMGPMQVLLPRYAVDVLGMDPTHRGEFLLLLAIGMIIGGTLCAIFAKRLHLGAVILTGTAVGAIAIFAISISHTVLSSGVGLLVAGMAGGFTASLIVAGLQDRSPPEIRGRVLSMYTIGTQVFPAVSGMIAGVLSQNYGVTKSLQISAIAVLILTLFCALTLKAVRHYHNISDHS